MTVTPGQFLIYDNFDFSGTVPGRVPNVSALGDAWRQDAGASSYTNGSMLVTEGGGGWTVNTIDSGGADVDVTVDWTPASPGGVWGGIVFRMTDPSNYYGLTYMGDSAYLVRVRHGVANQLARVTLGEPERGQMIQLAVQAFDDGIVVKFNDTVIMSIVDGFSATATRHGVLWNSTSDPFSSFDNFRATGTLPPAVTTLTLDAPSTTLFVDYSETATAAALDPGGAPVSGVGVRWFSSNAAVVSKSATGPLTATIMAREIGTSIVTANAARGPAGGASLTVTVAACVDPLPFSAADVPAGGNTGTISQTAPAGCDWNARSEAPWIAITQGTTGSGSRTVTYTTQPNGVGAARVGTIFLGGRRLTVTQPPTPCSYGIWPQQGNWAGDGGTGAFDVTPSGTCPGWTAYTGEPWIHVTTTSGTGPAAVFFTVDSNPISTSRSGLIGLGNATYSVTQDVAGTTGGGGFGSGSGGGGNGGSGGHSDVGNTIIASPGMVHVPGRWRSGALSLLTAAGHGWVGMTTASWLQIRTTGGQGSATVWYAASPNPTGAERTAEIVFTDGQTSTTVTVVQRRAQITPNTACGDFDCDAPPEDDCGWGGDSGPGVGEGGAGGIHDPWCDDAPYGSDDPHCRSAHYSLPIHIRLESFGETSMCVGAPPPTSSINVQCRPVDNSISQIVNAVHCYVVTRDQNGVFATTQGEEQNNQIDGRLRVMTDNLVPAQGNSTLDPSYYFAEGPNLQGSIDCLKSAAAQIDQMRLPYHYLGPNSNSALAAMFRVCKLNVFLPAQAIGKDVKLGPGIAW